MTEPVAMILISQAQSNELKIDSQGKSTFSIRATARLAGIQESSIRRQFDSAALKGSKLGEMLSEQGFEGAALKSWVINGIPDIAVSCIIGYYAMHAGRHCTEEAKNMMTVFTALGLRVFVQKVVGYQSAIAPTVPQLPPTPSPRLTELTNEQSRIRKVITELKQLVSNEELKLQEVSQSLIAEARAFQKANADVMKQAVLCNDILKRAEQENPYMSVKSVSLK